MLKIRKEQEEALRLAATKRFINDMVVQVRNHFDETKNGKSEKDAKEYVLKAIERAKKHNLTKEADLIKYIELTLMYGLEFDKNADLLWMSEIILDKDDPNPGNRINRLYKESLKRKKEEQMDLRKQ
ncbi:MAG: hypothetical protein R2750_06235 [Bacteroidales bacterium]